MNFYRAADYEGADVLTSFAQDKDDARAYLDNPGFGGNTLWKIKHNVRKNRVFNVSDEQNDMDALKFELVDLTEDSSWIIDYDYGSDFVFEVLLQKDIVRKILAKKYDWIVFEDNYPENGITWMVLTEAEAQRISDAEWEALETKD